MSRRSVEIVVVSWKRPQNLDRIVAAMRRQSVPCTVTLCDCHPTSEFEIPEATLAQFDRVYRWSHNFGGFNRYVPIAGYDHEFTYFADDDIVPGSRCVEHFLDHSQTRFGVLGQVGRRLKPDMVYRPRDVARGDRIKEVDLIVQAYFVRTRNLAHVVRARWDLGQEVDVSGEDDIVLAIAMRRAGLGSYLTPLSSDPETSIALENLPSPHSICGRSDHLDRRTALFAKAQRIGWRPLGARRETPWVWALRGHLVRAERRIRHQRRLRTDEHA